MIINKEYLSVHCVCLNNYFKGENRILNCHIQRSELAMSLPCPCCKAGRLISNEGCYVIAKLRTLCENYIKKNTMRSSLKRITVRKNYKENISMEAGVDPTNLLTAADLLAYSAITHSLIWRPSRVADTPPLLPIYRYGYRLFVADVCLCSEVLQLGGYWSSSGSCSM